MARWRDLAAVSCVALEPVAVGTALLGDDELAVALHAAACAGLAFALCRRFRAGPAAWTLIFSLALFLPIAGAVGVVTAAWVKLAPQERPGPELIRTPIPGPLEAVPPPPPPRDVRAQVAAARGRSTPAAVALLRRALRNPDEDVRLIAYAVLESKSRAAYRAIHEATAELAAAKSEAPAALHRALAARHWELAWLGLADGECRDHVLERARSHALAALALEPERASLHFLVARIELRRGSPQSAESALIRALRLGFPEATARPYLAEAAFLARRFDRVREHFDACAEGRGRAAIDRVRRYWT